MIFILYALVLFTVAAYSQCDISITQSPGILIPDVDPAGIQTIQDNITTSAQPSGCFVDSLSISLGVNHYRVSDLHFSLNGFEFFANQCGNEDHLYVTVTDASATPYGCANGGDDVQPISPFANEFGGQLLDVETVWTLSVYDDLGGSGTYGTLQSWTLCITTYCPTTTTMAITTATTTMPISTATTTMAISSDSSSESADSAESDDSSDDANNALFAGNEAMDNNNNELPEYGTYSLTLRFSDFALGNIWFLMCVICVVNAIVCCVYHKKKTNCY